jgi:hypothetical protein
MKKDITRVYLDNLVRRSDIEKNIIDKDWIERKFYSYKNEIIKLNQIDKEKFENILRESYKNKTITFISAESIKNTFNGYQDVVINFEADEDCYDIC